MEKRRRREWGEEEERKKKWLLQYVSALTINVKHFEFFCCKTFFPVAPAEHLMSICIRILLHGNSNYHVLNPTATNTPHPHNPPRKWTYWPYGGKSIQCDFNWGRRQANSSPPLNERFFSSFTKKYFFSRENIFLPRSLVAPRRFQPQWRTRQRWRRSLSASSPERRRS